MRELRTYDQRVRCTGECDFRGHELSILGPFRSGVMIDGGICVDGFVSLSKMNWLKKFIVFVVYRAVGTPSAVIQSVHTGGKMR